MSESLRNFSPSTRKKVHAKTLFFGFIESNYRTAIEDIEYGKPLIFKWLRVHSGVFRATWHARCVGSPV